MTENLSIKPYARLITMLGDQLITDEAVALIEIIKNAYDADAENVHVDFIGFDEDFNANPVTSKIIVTDDGTGMTREVLTKSWMNPAAPEKYVKKRDGNGLTKRKRYIQGEKGIGRFAIFKLGFDATIITSPVNPDEDLNGKAYRLDYSFKDYGVEFLGNEEPILLEELKIPFSTIENKEYFCEKSSHGTRIEISSLKNNWGKSQLDKVITAVSRIKPLFDKSDDSFNVSYFRNGEFVPDVTKKSEEDRESLLELLESKAVFSIKEGLFRSRDCSYSFKINGKQSAIGLDGVNIKKYTPEFIDRLKARSKEVGDFEYSFYIFDFAANQIDDPKHYLTKKEKDIIKKNRVYLYRDRIRVLPYGDPDDDWLQIDVARGTERAGEFFSNDQLVGQISITSSGNPKLRDKTSREGLIDDGLSKTAFIELINVFLKWIKIEFYEKYKIEKRKVAEAKDKLERKTSSLLDELAADFSKNGQEEMAEKVKAVAASYEKDKAWYEEKVEITERLAGIGLAVETGFHDARLFLKRAMDQLANLQIEYQLLGKEDDSISSILGNLTMVKNMLDNIDLLYPNAKNKEKNVDIEEVARVVLNYYKTLLHKHEVNAQIKVIKPFKVKCVDAVILQALLNLFDNAFYWCKDAIGGGKIEITIDGNEKTLTITDNGRGVQKNDLGYIFEAFFTRKGEDGHGLGLYIARQLMRRYGFDIALTQIEKDELHYAGEFVISFNKNGED